MPGFPLATLAEIGIPSASACLLFASPFLALIALIWLMRRIDRVIEHLFPSWEWERKLGWLHLGAHRQADAIWRWMRSMVHAALAVALYGIVWGAEAMPALGRGLDATGLALFITRLPVLLLSIGAWLVYLGFLLIPKVRNQYEKEELEKFRAAQDEIEREQEQLRAARGNSFLPKPRFDSPPPRANRLGSRDRLN